jgi:hypothetical protein
MPQQGMRVVGIVALAVVALGAPACERSLSPQTGAGRLSPEGLPIATALPAASSWCIVTYGPGGAAEVASWDAPTRTFINNGDYWTVDDGSRVVEEGAIDGKWRMFRSYDARGVPAGYRYEEQGQALYNYDQHNEYDAGGRLLASHQVYTSSNMRTTVAYQYEGQHLRGVTTHTEQDGQTWDTTLRFAWDGERVVARDWGDETAPDERDVRRYDESGRLVGADIDFGFTGPDDRFVASDGKIDIRYQWTYDDAGRITRLDQDGRYSVPPPGLDGTPDESLIFDPACVDIAVVPSALYRIERWLAPL